MNVNKLIKYHIMTVNRDQECSKLKELKWVTDESIAAAWYLYSS